MSKLRKYELIQKYQNAIKKLISENDDERESFSKHFLISFQPPININDLSHFDLKIISKIYKTCWSRDNEKICDFIVTCTPYVSNSNSLIVQREFLKLCVTLLSKFPSILKAIDKNKQDFFETLLIWFTKAPYLLDKEFLKIFRRYIDSYPSPSQLIFQFIRTLQNRTYFDFKKHNYALDNYLLTPSSNLSRALQARGIELVIAAVSMLISNSHYDLACQSVTMLMVSDLGNNTNIKSVLTDDDFILVMFLSTVTQNFKLFHHLDRLLDSELYCKFYELVHPTKWFLWFLEYIKFDMTVIVDMALDDRHVIIYLNCISNLLTNNIIQRQMFEKYFKSDENTSVYCSSVEIIYQLIEKLKSGNIQCMDLESLAESLL